MDCQTLMVASPGSLRGTDPVRKAIAELMQHKASSLAVVDEHDGYLGVIRIRDLLGLALPRVVRATTSMRDLSFLHEALSDIKRRLGESLETPLASVLDTEAPVVKPDTSLTEALLYFYRGHTMLPVVDGDGKKLLGVVTRVDALRVLSEQP